jgi:hypothetical protein
LRLLSISLKRACTVCVRRVKQTYFAALRIAVDAEFCLTDFLQRETVRGMERLCVQHISSTLQLLISQRRWNLNEKRRGSENHCHHRRGEQGFDFSVFGPQ